MWVFDATPLIYLAKVDRLDVVTHLEGPRRIPRRVYTEVVADAIDAGHVDARRIEQRIDDGLFDVVAVDDSPLATRLAANPNLSDADVAVLACAAIHDGIAVMDETAGRTAADVEGIETRGTAYLVLSCAKDGSISVSDARETIDSMIDHGWYCAPDLYAKLLGTLESFES